MTFSIPLETSLADAPKPTAIHLALSALDNIRFGLPVEADPKQAVHIEALRAEIRRLLKCDAQELPEEIETMIGEMYVFDHSGRTADLTFCYL
jgi:hypothetical protein